MVGGDNSFVRHADFGGDPGFVFDQSGLSGAKDDRTTFDKMLDRDGIDGVSLVVLFLVTYLALITATQKRLVTALKELNDNTQQMNKYSEELADLNKLKAKQGTAKSSDNIPPSDQLDKVKNILKGEGIEVKDPMTWGDLDGALAELKAKSDSVGNSNSQFLLTVQNLQSALTNASDQATNGTNKLWGSLQNIAGNFR